MDWQTSSDRSCQPCGTRVYAQAESSIRRKDGAPQRLVPLCCKMMLPVQTEYTLHICCALDSSYVPYRVVASVYRCGLKALNRGLLSLSQVVSSGISLAALQARQGGHSTDDRCRLKTKSDRGRWLLDRRINRYQCQTGNQSLAGSCVLRKLRSSSLFLGVRVWLGTRDSNSTE